MIPDHLIKRVDSLSGTVVAEQRAKIEHVLVRHPEESMILSIERASPTCYMTIFADRIGFTPTPPIQRSQISDAVRGCLCLSVADADTRYDTDHPQRSKYTPVTFSFHDTLHSVVTKMMNRLDKDRI